MHVLQNNLLYLAVGNLPAATFQVTYQIKLLTTAIFSVTMLGRKLTVRQWTALLILFIGVAVVKMNNSKSVEKSSEGLEQNAVLGFGAVLLACVSSGFAGVYFEKILKTSDVSLWTRNIQLGSFGLIIALSAAFLKDGKIILEKGFFNGYNVFVWSTVAVQALGGLLVAIVIKYCDNIMKGFAYAVSIIISAVFSYFIFGFEVTIMFVLGTSLVIFAVILYLVPAKQGEKDEKMPKVPTAEEEIRYLKTFHNKFSITREK